LLLNGLTIFYLTSGEDLDELVNLIDHDSDDDFIDQLYGTDQEQSDNTPATNGHQHVVNTSNDGGETEPSQDHQVSPENMSSMLTKIKINPALLS
jgi:hypothetical protein